MMPSRNHSSKNGEWGPRLLVGSSDAKLAASTLAIVNVHRDMTRGMRFHVFRYTKYYHRMAGTELALDLLTDAGVQGVLQVRH